MKPFKLVNDPTVNRLRFALRNIEGVPVDVVERAQKVNSLDEFFAFAENNGIDIQIKVTKRKDGKVGGIRVSIEK